MTATADVSLLSLLTNAGRRGWLDSVAYGLARDLESFKQRLSYSIDDNGTVPEQIRTKLCSDLKSSGQSRTKGKGTKKGAGST